MKQIITALVMIYSTMAWADYRLIVPQEPGGGTAVWAQVMKPHLEKALGEPVIIEHIPGASDIPGFNRFHNELRRDPKTIMVSHGGNAESFLTDRVDYNYREYEPIALVNLNIAVSRRKDFDPTRDSVKFGALSGRRPDVMALTMMMCGPLPSVQAYIDCYRKRVVYVKGMKPTEARLAALRGELNVVRETFVSHRKFIKPQVDQGVFVDWFNHGVLDLASGRIVQDPNFTMPDFETAYRERWGQAPRGDFYDAYVLVKSFRDVLQKALWVDRGNPNAERIRDAVRRMLADPDARAAIIADGGDYQWFIGTDMARAYQQISARVTEKSLRDLVTFTESAMEIRAQFKPELIRK